MLSNSRLGLRWTLLQRQLANIVLTGGSTRARSCVPALDGRVVLISGASSGIGRALALKLAPSGATLVLVARSEDKLATLRAEVSALGGRALVFAADLSSAASCEALLRRLQTDGIAVDLLVNNAGRSIRRAVSQACDRVHDYERTMALNYFGSLRLILGLLPGMCERERGHIINISSVSVPIGTPLFSAYVASKAALDGFTRVVAAETRNRGVRFSTIHMPLVRTPMIVPTAEYRDLPTLSPEQAADLIVHALTTRESEIGTKLTKLFQLTHALAPNALQMLLARCHAVLSGENSSPIVSAPARAAA